MCIHFPPSERAVDRVVVGPPPSASLRTRRTAGRGRADLGCEGRRIARFGTAAGLPRGRRLGRAARARITIAGRHPIAVVRRWPHRDRSGPDAATWDRGPSQSRAGRRNPFPPRDRRARRTTGRVGGADPQWPRSDMRRCQFRRRRKRPGIDPPEVRSGESAPKIAQSATEGRSRIQSRVSRDRSTIAR